MRTTSLAAPHLDLDTEESLVHAWRAEQLREHGMPRLLTEAYADTVDWHAYADLVGRVCSPDLALDRPLNAWRERYAALCLGAHRNVWIPAGLDGRWWLPVQTGGSSSVTLCRKKNSSQTKGHALIDTRRLTFIASAAAALLATLALAGCGSGGSSTAQAAPKPASGQSATVGIANTGLGNILVNSAGRTVYLFGKDTGTQSTCTGACAQNWPPLLAKGTPTAGSGATSSMLGTTTRSDGGRQVTYNGHPLYLFVGDKKPGDTNGQGLTAFGGSWFALTAAGNQVSGQGTNSGGGGGFGY
jgi:predicted lipoprotein with Yx(FWY)xxD motif